MRASNYFHGKVKENFEKFFDKTFINRVSKSTKFVARRDYKITPFAFVSGLIESCFSRRNTYSSWASSIGAITGKEVTKQALFNRMNERTTEFASALFSHALKVRLEVPKQQRLFTLFKRVLLGDSSTLSLPQNLAKDFPGNVSKGEQKAIARLQCVINIKTMHWLQMSLKSFTNNDQSASCEILPLLKKGDLLIRDLGYFVLRALSGIIDKNAFFITRLRYGLTLFNEANKEINWKQLCKRKGVIDCKIFIGRQEKIPVRIIMIPLPAAQVAEKIRKAKTDRDKRVNHSPDYYHWIKYNVFVTNVEQDILSAHEIAEVYKTRWQIEIIFKSWKSGGDLQKLLHEKCTNVYRVKTTIFLIMMFFCLVMHKVYARHYKSIDKYGKCLSLLKFMTYV